MNFPIVTGLTSAKVPVPLLVDASGRPIITQEYDDRIEHEVILAQTEKTATWESDHVADHGYIGAYITFVVTAVPGGGVSATLAIYAEDATESIDLAAMSGSALTGISGRSYFIYPGAAVGNSGFDKVSGAILPPEFYYKVTHSAAGAFTYGIEAWYLKW